MGKYTYVDPVERGFTKFKLSRKQHHSLIKNRKLTKWEKCDYYYNDSIILVHKYFSMKTIIIITIMFPILVLIQGLGKIKESWDDYLELFNQKEKGKHSSFTIHKNHKAYDLILNEIKYK